MTLPPLREPTETRVVEPPESRVIWKYAIPLGSEMTLALPGRIIHVGIQDGWPMLWVELLRGEAGRDRTFRVFGTGHDIPAGWEHRGTVMDAPFVWHVYERVSA